MQGVGDMSAEKANPGKTGPGRTSPEKAREKRLDETIEDTFPASDPPSNTPVEGTRKAERDRGAPAQPHKARPS